MKKLSFFDEVKTMIEVSKTSKIYILLILFFLVFIYSLFIQKNTKKKSKKKTELLISLFFFLITIITYYQILGKMVDNMINHFFITLYFPNLAIYTAMIITINIILWSSLFHSKTKKEIKRINTIVYCIENYLYLLIVNEINRKNLDIFTQQSIYKNKEVRALIELASTIFIIWILFLIIYKLIRRYQKKNEPSPKKKTVKEKKELEENHKEEQHPNNMVVQIEKQQKEKEKPSEKERGNWLDDQLTLEDYKKVLSLLKEYQQRKQAKEKIQQTQKEQLKYQQIEQLYRKSK